MDQDAVLAISALRAPRGRRSPPTNTFAPVPVTLSGNEHRHAGTGVLAPSWVGGTSHTAYAFSIKRVEGQGVGAWSGAAIVAV